MSAPRSMRSASTRSVPMRWASRSTRSRWCGRSSRAASSTLREGLEQLIVVEEKRSIIEAAVKDELYHLKGAPQVVGKRDENGAPLFQAHGALDTLQIAVAIGERLLRFADPTALKERVASLKAAMAARGKAPDIAARTPYFCAGCPHNSSTVVPDGSRAYAGIGCHYMAQFDGPRHRGLHPHGRRGRQLDRRGAVLQHRPRVPEHRRRHLCAFGLDGDPRRRRRPASTSPTRSSTTTRWR